MSVQEDIQYYRRRAAEARARGKETLAQTMENYAANLESGLYDDSGVGAFDIGASNRRWAEQERLEREKEARRRAAEERLYAQQPRRSSGGGSGRSGGYAPQRSQAPAPSYSEPSYSYSEPPADYAAAPQGGYRDYRGGYTNDNGHSGLVAYGESDMSPRDWAQARGMSDDVERNKYGHAKGSFVDFLDNAIERGKQYDW